MDIQMLAGLKPGDGEEPIEVRVIRKWTSRRGEYCFIFVDKNGTAIQTAANISDKAYFDSQLRIGNCYRIRNYICERATTVMKTVEHETSIKMGKAATFEVIPTIDFPAYYFNFQQYHQLSARTDKHDILTDYIGKIEHVTDVQICKGIPLRKLTLKDLSGNMIEATFWDTTAHSFNKEAVMQLPSPVIAAVTSMKVTKYNETQLTGTPASHIYINPDIEETRTMTIGFAAAPEDNVLKIQYDRSTDMELEKHRNRISLAELLNLPYTILQRTQFTCNATLTAIDENRKWYYKACDQCRKSVSQIGKAFMCADHQPVIQPRILYSFTGTISDDTAEIKAIFFNDGAKSLLQTECEKMVTQLGYDDPHILPTPLTALRGATKIFQVRLHRTDNQGVKHFSVDRVFEINATPSNASRIANTATPASSITTYPLASSSTSSETHKRQTLAKKELFKNPDKEQTKRPKQSDNTLTPGNKAPQATHK